MSLQQRIEARIEELGDELKKVEKSGTRTQYNSIKAQKQELETLIGDEQEKEEEFVQPDQNIKEQEVNKQKAEEELEKSKKALDKKQREGRAQRETKDVEVNTTGEEE